MLKSVLPDLKVIELIKRGGNQEERAIRHLLNRHGEKVMGYTMKKGASKEEAEDVLYDAMSSLVLNVKANKFNGDSSLATYLVAIGKRKWYKTIASKHQTEPIDIADVKIPDGHHFYEDQEGSAFGSQSLLSQLLSVLRPGCKDVLTLWCQRISMDEIAKFMGFKNGQIAMNKKSKCFRQLLLLVDNSPKLKTALADLHFS